jgi:hypothetical protein
MIIPTPMPLGQQSKPFDDPNWLAAALVREVNADVAVLDGDLAVPDQTGRTVGSDSSIVGFETIPNVLWQWGHEQSLSSS